MKRIFITLNIFKKKVVIIRSVRRKNYFINYKFLKKYENFLFIGLNDEYRDLKKTQFLFGKTHTFFREKKNTHIF